MAAEKDEEKEKSWSDVLRYEGIKTFWNAMNKLEGVSYYILLF